MSPDHTGRDDAPSRPVCPACGQPLKAPRRLCACGHPETSHDITRTGKLTWCASYSPAGPCKCEAFTERGDEHASNPS